MVVINGLAITAGQNAETFGQNRQRAADQLGKYNGDDQGKADDHCNGDGYPVNNKQFYKIGRGQSDPIKMPTQSSFNRIFSVSE